MQPHVLVASDPAALAEAGARLWVDTCKQAIEARGAFHVALSGGRTPEALYRAVARASDLDSTWHRTHVWWSDERAVAPHDERSNFRLAKLALLDDVPLAEAHVHRMRGEATDLDAEAARYATEVPSAFDLIWLGVGEDGHTASIFPGSPALATAGPAVLAVDGPGGVPPRRLTFSLGLINAARRVVVVATGRSKRDVIARARKTGAVGLDAASDRPGDSPPIARVRPAHGQLVWLLDAEAAGA